MNVIDLKAPYSRDSFLSFFRDHFLPEDLTILDERIDLSFQSNYIKDVSKIGEISSLDLAVYEIKHHSESDPRVSLSRDSFRLLSQFGRQRALVLFISGKKDPPARGTRAGNYRLSLVTIDLKWEEGKRVQREYSNPRRYSFFLGPDAKTHTPEEYLLKPGRVKDFEDLRRRFSIEVVNKEFYTGIAILFTQLAGGKRSIGRQKFDEKGFLVLPSTADDTLRKEFAVRLIGRLVFCWFLRKKRSKKGISLLPEELLSSDAVHKTAKYYHDILEPLFFQVLNTPVTQRGKMYQKEPWSLIPFLNGGLFNPHSHDFYEPGAMNMSRHINTLKVPDRWIKELFELFETYNFTIDENTSMDVELSIDPEMLGRIFENLLAEINPETGETARKATGSYYTPRPIVDYMVDESLKQYLQANTDLKEEIISLLLAYEVEDVSLSEREREAVINALDTVKVLDPACGSGAFPMGILQKMLLILQKVDPDSKLWLKRQIAKIENPILRKNIETKLKTANVNYIHKLGIIQSAIYGVDIQPVAVDISKLRFFLSLIVDEKVDDERENRGIEPLPNLEFKFVCANSLIGLPQGKSHYEKTQTKFFEASSEIDLLKNLRDEYLRSWGREKASIEKRFRETQSRMFRHSLNWMNHGGKGGKDSQTLKLSQWDPFSFESCGWFDPEWMFGITTNSPLPKGDKGGCGGFDIVIANPPYGAEMDNQTLKNIVESYSYYDRQKNSASFFIEVASRLAKKNATVTYIVPKSLSFSEGWQRTRRLITEINTLHIVADVSKAFENVLLEAIIISFLKRNTKTYSFISGEGWNNEIILTGSPTNKLIKEFDILPVYITPTRLSILRKMSLSSVPLSSISQTFRGLPLQSKISKNGDFILRGKNIGRYKIYNEIDRIFLPSDFLQKKKVQDIMQRKIVSQNIVAHVLNPYDRIIIMAALEMDGILTLDTVMNTILTAKNYKYEYILALLNSQLASWFYYWFVYNRAIRTMHFDKYYLGKLPIKNVKLSIQQPFITLVDQILTAKQKDPNADTSVLERQIDQMVYNLYGLTPEESAIIDGGR